MITIYGPPNSKVKKEKNQTLLTYGPIDYWLGSNREPIQEPYQSEDLIEYYKRCIGQNEQRRDKLTWEGAKVNFQHFISHLASIVIIPLIIDAIG